MEQQRLDINVIIIIFNSKHMRTPLFDKNIIEVVLNNNFKLEI